LQIIYQDNKAIDTAVAADIIIAKVRSHSIYSAATTAM